METKYKITKKEIKTLENYAYKVMGIGNNLLSELWPAEKHAENIYHESDNILRELKFIKRN